MSVQSIGNLLDKTVYELRADPEGPNFLKGHPGDSFDVLETAMSRMRCHRAFSALGVEEFKEAIKPMRAEFDKAQLLCESPIERMMLAALMAGHWHFIGNPYVPVYPAQSLERMPALPVVIIPQFVVMRYRIDLAIAVRGDRSGGLIAVECDGADFHDQEKDRVRDFNLSRLGVRVFRFSGKHIHASAADLADVVIASASEMLA